MDVTFSLRFFCMVQSAKNDVDALWNGCFAEELDRTRQKKVKKGHVGFKGMLIVVE